jgi:hypothetical protein
MMFVFLLCIAYTVFCLGMSTMAYMSMGLEAGACTGLLCFVMSSLLAHHTLS